MAVLSICFLALFAYAVGYDFEDPYYNQVLASELEDVENTFELIGTQHGARRRRQIDGDNDDDDFEKKHKHKKHHHGHHNKHHHHHGNDHHRHHHRRHHDDNHHHKAGHHQHNNHNARYRSQQQQDACHRKPFSQCCDIDIMRHHRYQNNENRQECFLQVYGDVKNRYSVAPNMFKCEDPQKLKRDMTCFVQCMAQKGNLIDSDGDLIESQFTAFVRDHVKEEWLQPHLGIITNKCLNEAENATLLQGKEGDVMQSCNPAAIKAGHCLLRELQMYCPNEEITNPERCEKFRAMVNQKFENDNSISRNSVE